MDSVDCAVVGAGKIARTLVVATSDAQRDKLAALHGLANDCIGVAEALQKIPVHCSHPIAGSLPELPMPPALYCTLATDFIPARSREIITHWQASKHLIRIKISAAAMSVADFLFASYGSWHYLALYGIESPGSTVALAIADLVFGLIG